ncbi:MAG: hypothetical protein HFE65_03080 [Clostridiales bacterium]|nr:hypothetical protein [Clostridiales bacterium]
MDLRIELLPKTAWGMNLRKMLKQSDWDKIRKAVYEKEKMKCHICYCECKSLDAHEIWHFDEKLHVQRLVDIIGVCKSCHNTIHYGRAQKIGYEKQAIDQFLKVNKCEIPAFKQALKKAKSRYDKLSRITGWKLDVSLIEQQGYHVIKT